MGLGMDSRYPATREELYTVQMDIKQLQIASQHHADRLSRLEKRQADDANLRSVWQSPFPSVMGGTPQQDPVQMPANDDFDEDFDPEHGQNLLGSLHLEADDEPVRRGVAASRANSVRFDESALQSASWGHNSRHSGDFGLVRPSSGFGTHGMMERSLSHKSDGRHSSAGHSVHSVHSVPSGRASSLGLDTHFGIGTHEDESPVDVLEPPPGLFVMGPFPSVIRCWLTVNFAHDTLLYAVVCSGSQKSTVDYSLVKELDLMPEVHRDIAGVHRIRLPVFLAEAIVTQRHPRTNGTATQTIPSITTSFEIVGMEQSESTDSKKGIRIFLGCDTLRAHSADILFSQNTMVLVGDQREKLTVPFARPEDDSVFKYLSTINAIPGKPKLNATAPPFVSTNSSSEIPKVAPQIAPKSTDDVASPSASHVSCLDASVASNPSENGGASCGNSPKDPELATTKEATVGTPTATENSRRDSTASSIWGSWRQGTPASINGGNSDSYNQSSRSGRNMKVLKPMKSSSARTGASYEPPLPSRPSGELRRKSTVGENGTTISTGGIPAPTPAMRWEQKRASISAESREKAAENTKPISPLPRASLRSANPVGGASAFSWMNPGTKAKTGTAGGE